jgi:hypothetical protein
MDVRLAYPTWDEAPASTALAEAGGIGGAFNRRVKAGRHTIITPRRELGYVREMAKEL